MAFDYSKLRGRIVEKFATQAAFSEALKLSQKSLSAKMTGKVFFTQKDINKFIALLDIPREQIDEYFFTLKVQKVEQKGEA